MGARATLWGYVGFIYECCIKGTQEAWQLLRDASEIRDAESGIEEVSVAEPARE